MIQRFDNLPLAQKLTVPLMVVSKLSGWVTNDLGQVTTSSFNPFSISTTAPLQAATNGPSPPSKSRARRSDYNTPDASEN